MFCVSWQRWRSSWHLTSAEGRIKSYECGYENLSAGWPQKGFFIQRDKHHLATAVKTAIYTYTFCFIHSWSAEFELHSTKLFQFPRNSVTVVNQIRCCCLHTATTSSPMSTFVTSPSPLDNTSTASASTTSRCMSPADEVPMTVSLAATVDSWSEPPSSRPLTSLAPSEASHDRVYCYEILRCFSSFPYTNRAKNRQSHNTYWLCN